MRVPVSCGVGIKIKKIFILIFVLKVFSCHVIVRYNQSRCA